MYSQRNSIYLCESHAHYQRKYESVEIILYSWRHFYKSEAAVHVVSDERLQILLN